MSTSIIFSRGGGSGSIISRIMQVSPWDRVAIDFKDGFVCEISKYEGVRIHHRNIFYELLGKHVEINVDVPDQRRCVDYIRDRTHLRYGWLHLFRLPTTENYNRNHTTPAEFISGALRAGNVALRFDPGLITPVRLWLALLSNNPDIRH
ncbi:MAG: hypothetical protein CL582_10665 [Alteromonadaceae bacterium]|nr:hypothetical protein [Alteromonadaceae bacterium]